MKTYSGILIVLLLCTAIAAQAQAPADIVATFAEGNTLYEQGEYEAAIERYASLVARGVVDPTLYYNIGNAYYKSHDLAGAVLNYERVLRIEPRHDAARTNLELVRSQLTDKQFVPHGNRFTQGVIFLHDKLSTNEMVVLAFVAYTLLSLVIIIFVFRRTDSITTLYRRLSVVSPARLLGLSIAQDLLVLTAILFFLSVTSGVSAYAKVKRDSGRRQAVVMVAEIPVYGSPTEDATLHFKIHEGTMVSVRESRSDWVRIQLPGGLSGWVSAVSVERL